MLAIVIPAYDMHTHGVHFLARALDSIKKQTGIDLSQIDVVISDHSVNFEIEEFLLSYQAPFKLHYIRNSTHFGNISQNLNHATQFVLQKCTSSYIKVLFQDDFLLGNDHLAGINRIAQDAKPDAIFTGATHSADGTTFYNPISPQNNPFLIFGQNSISSPSTLIISRKLCEEQLCDEQVQLLMDVDWYYRIFKEYSSIVFAPELLVVNGVWDGQMQHQFDAQSFAKELSYVLIKYEGDALREQIPAYLEMLHAKYPEHAQQIDPVVRRLMQAPVSINHNESSTKSGNSVDVILVTQNAQEHINFSIRNVLLQSTPPRNIWVIDANSADQTQNLVERIYAKTPQVRYLKSSSAAIWQARQWGVGYSDVKYIAFLDCTQDHHPKWSSNYLEQQTGLLEKNPQILGVISNIAMNNATNNDGQFAVLDLPACGMTSNLVVNRENATQKTSFLDQLRLAQQHNQWQLFSALFQLTANQDTQVTPSTIFKTLHTHHINELQALLIWWSNYPDVIATQAQLLELIRKGMIGMPQEARASVFEHLSHFHRSYVLLKPTLHEKLYKLACISYLNMTLDIIQSHLHRQLASIKQGLARIPGVVNLYQALFKRPLSH